MYNNNFKKWMTKLVNVQKDILLFKKENVKNKDINIEDSPKK